MENSNQPKKETVSLDSLPDVVAKPLAANPRLRETVRIQLPTRPGSPPPAAIPAASSPRVKPMPVPLVPAPGPAPPEPQTETARVGIMGELKKEIARVPLVAEPPSKPLPRVQMKKTQRLVAIPEAATPRASISVAATEESTRNDPIPMSLCWTLLGVSAIVLIIQIWTYFS